MVALTRTNTPDEASDLLWMREWVRDDEMPFDDEEQGQEQGPYSGLFRVGCTLVPNRVCDKKHVAAVAQPLT